jgi:hypothetical protein
MGREWPKKEHLRMSASVLSRLEFVSLLVYFHGAKRGKGLSDFLPYKKNLRF